MWNYWGSSEGLPASGWKIHVSLQPQELMNGLEAVKMVARNHGTPCKTLKSVAHFYGQNGQHAPRLGGGSVPRSTRVTLKPSMLSSITFKGRFPPMRRAREF